MDIYNEDKTIKLDENELDFTKGYLIDDVLIVHISEQEAISRQTHYEVIKEYANGGKDLKEIVDVEGQPYIPEHDEEQKIQVYKLYTEQELKNFRIGELKQQLNATDYQAIKYAEGEISEEDYLPIKEQRRAWRAEINQLESELK